MNVAALLAKFDKGAKFAGSVGHPMTKMLSASARPAVTLATRKRAATNFGAW